jgi:hypothetical protein
MRLVAWNCQDAFRNKYEALLRLKPDIAVVSEARRTCLNVVDRIATSSDWVGETNSKGLGMISFNGWQLTRAGLAIAESWFAPVIASKGETIVQVVGVWVKPNQGSYVKPTLRSLDALREFIAASPTIVVGDFNQSVNFGGSPGGRFQDVLDAFDRLQMVSAWHARHGETHGAESQPTLHQNRKAHDPFHIDYAFVPKNHISTIDVGIGTFEDYVAAELSDHVPLTLDIG